MEGPEIVREPDKLQALKIKDQAAISKNQEYSRTVRSPEAEKTDSAASLISQSATITRLTGENAALTAENTRCTRLVAELEFSKATLTGKLDDQSATILHLKKNALLVGPGTDKIQCLEAELRKSSDELIWKNLVIRQLKGHKDMSKARIAQLEVASSKTSEEVEFECEFAWSPAVLEAYTIGDRDLSADSWLFNLPGFLGAESSKLIKFLAPVKVLWTNLQAAEKAKNIAEGALVKMQLQHNEMLSAIDSVKHENKTLRAQLKDMADRLAVLRGMSVGSLLNHVWESQA